MKPEELQIYDWVLINDTPHQVKQITQKKVGYHKVPYSLDYARLVDVKPIPITAEILEKNEIKNDCVSRWYEWIGENAKILFNPYYLVLSIESKDVAIKGRFDYVHQLQQAIRLCGINKRIKL
jgi:hypothetical protein